ncbi:MAG TPA: tetratricopeptide repeat protein [Kofleriaceae bacterium]|nr:tetratricopeptide repeat protein [Kofleriaceae bacterium]
MRVLSGKLVAAVAALGLVLASGHPAAAQPSPVVRPTPSEAERQEAARVHFDRARQLHADRRYLEAADAYLAAFSEVPMPAFLYNAAQVYRLAGERDKAIEYYRRYLELEPEGEGSADARAFLAELERADAAADAPPTDSGAPDAPPTAQDRPLEPGGGAALAPAPARDDGTTPGRSLRVAALISFGVGAIALGAAAGFAFKARSASDDLSDHHGEWTASEQDLYRAGEDAERYAYLSLGVGAAAVVTGGVLYLLGRRAEPPATIAPTGSGGAVVLLGATF